MRSGMVLLAGATSLLLLAEQAAATTMDYLSAWSASRIYEVGAVVVRGNEVYYALKRSRNSEPVPTNTNWQIIGRAGMDYDGEWSSRTIYQVGSVVRYMGQTFTSLRAGNLNRVPSPQSADWAVIGASGNTIRSGAGAPIVTNGSTGDFWIDTANSILYGPKTATGWPITGTPLRGTDGATGAQGAMGVPGATGATGARGATGAAGAAGPAGAPGPAGANGATGATGNNATLTLTNAPRNNASTTTVSSWFQVSLNANDWTPAIFSNVLGVGRYMVVGTIHANLPSGTSVTCALRDKDLNIIGERVTAANNAAGVSTDIRQMTMMGEEVVTEPMQITIGCTGLPANTSTPPRVGLGWIMLVKIE